MHDLQAISRMFQMGADFTDVRPIGSGHINDTYRASYPKPGGQVRFIHQRINHQVFKEPLKVMENVARVTAHALSALTAAGHPDASRRTLSCIPATDGKPYAIDAKGNVWRTYPFIEGARGYDQIETNEQAYQAASAFGAFQNLAATLGGERLHETIPDFHHTPKRLEALELAAQKDRFGRASGIAEEIDFARSRSTDCTRVTRLIETGEIPERVTHNDTKLNNVLLDDLTSEGLCVIDLDTTMPGSALYDFGDMVRTAVSNLAEDDPQRSKMEIQLDRFDALARGYLSTATFLNPTEISLLAFSGKLLTLECGIRFLTDYLDGDTYFKTHRPGHNLDRCRNQFALVRALEHNMDAMEKIVAAALPHPPRVQRQA
jgi:aminoglycoside phosphotransferase (APT) family kinase protein